MKALVVKDYAQGTLKRFEVLERHILDFLSFQYRKSDINIKNIDHEFISNFDIFFLFQNDHLLISLNSEYFLFYLYNKINKLQVMTTDLQKLHNIWLETRSHQNTDFPRIGFDELTNSIVSTGPFYYYVIDFYDMSLSNVSATINDIHGLDPEVVTFNDVLLTIHPDDVNFVANAEAFLGKFFRERIAREKLLSYKMSYSFRSMMKNGEYALLNHQAILLSLDENGRSGKSLNIHTRIDHLSSLNTQKISLIGLKGEPSYLNMSLEEKPLLCFSKREKQILKLISEGLGSAKIAEKLFIAESTVKKHRNNILIKADCKNTVQLIKSCILQGLL